MQELALSEIHNAELGALLKLDEICRANGLRYVIYYGTLLGAVRHKGFIPWDDDVDVIMGRPDFEKLISYCDSHKDELAPFRLMYYTNTPNYAYPIGRFSDTSYRVEYNDTNDYGLGLFVDIIPYDGCGNSYEKACKIVKRNQLIRHFVMMAGTKVAFESQHGKAVTLFKKAIFPIVKMVGLERLTNLEKHTIRKYNYEGSKYVCPATWISYGICEIAERAQVEDGEDIIFEGHKVMAPKNPEKHLQRLYGDYMRLPPAEKQSPTHDYKAYRKE